MCRHTQAAVTALLLLVPGASLAQSVNMGTTFHGLEARARRVVATFPEGIVDVHRGEGQAMEAVFRTHDGADGGGLTLAPGSRRVQWRRAGGGGATDFALPDQATISLDWAAHQLHALHEDEKAARAEGRPIEVGGEDGAWDGHLRRSRAALGRGVSSGQLASRVQAVETTFDEVVVRAALDRHERRPAGGKRVDYSRFTASIRDARTGAVRGFVRWFDTAQVLTWKIEGGSQGVVLPERLRGGWTFTPTMGWANVQAYQFVTQAASTLESGGPLVVRRGEEGPTPFALVARAVAPLPTLAAGAAGPRVREVVSDVIGDLALRGWPARGLRPVGSALVRNEPGCDNLHWLDGSIFRACCDVHDKCYETNGCNSSSWWWPFSGSWSCQRCNAQVVYCFCTVSNPAYCGGAVGSGGGDGGSSGGGCTSVAGGFCPVECQSCQAH